ASSVVEVCSAWQVSMFLLDVRCAARRGGNVQRVVVAALGQPRGGVFPEFGARVNYVVPRRARWDASPRHCRHWDVSWRSSLEPTEITVKSARCTRFTG